MPFYLGRKAIRKVPVVEAQENIRYDQLAALARHPNTAAWPTKATAGRPPPTSSSWP